MQARPQLNSLNRIVSAAQQKAGASLVVSGLFDVLSPFSDRSIQCNYINLPQDAAKHNVVQIRTNDVGGRIDE